MNAKLFVLIVFVAGGVRSPSASGQQGITVQLPTFSSFSVATSVIVPDRGSAYLGGVGRAASGSSRFGPGPGQSAFGAQRHASHMHVSAYIHDLRAMDEAIRGQVGPSAQGITSSQPNKAEPLPSLQEIAQQQRDAEQTQQAEARDYLKRAGEAQAAGKTGLAKIYLQMGLRRAQGELRDELSAQLAKLAPQPASRLADRR